MIYNSLDFYMNLSMLKSCFCKFALFILIISSPIFSFSQKVSIDEIIALRIKSLANVEEYLTVKGWQLTEANEPIDGRLGWATFAYEKSSISDKALSFITYYYDNNSSIFNRINIQVNSSSVYSSFISRLKTLGYKVSSSNVSEGKIVKIYKGKNITIEVKIGTHQDDLVTKTTYQFFICDSFDYSLQFE